MKEDASGLRGVLIRQALALLEEEWADLSLRQVARRAGVSAMAPYRHFEDKAAMLAAVAEHGFDLLREELERADGDRSDQEALVAQGEAYVAFARGHPALFRLMFSGQRARPTGGQLGEPAYAVLARRAASLSPSGDAVAATGCWALVHGLATLFLDRRLPGEGPEVRAILTAWVSALGRGG